jgi:hypothetical protein
MTCLGCCTTVRGKARSTKSGSYWMSGPGGPACVHQWPRGAHAAALLPQHHECHVKWDQEPRLNEFKVEDNKRTRGQHDERTRGRRDESQRNNQPAQEDEGAAE